MLGAAPEPGPMSPWCCWSHGPWLPTSPSRADEQEEAGLDLSRRMEAGSSYLTSRFCICPRALGVWQPRAPGPELGLSPRALGGLWGVSRRLQEAEAHQPAEGDTGGGQQWAASGLAMGGLELFGSQHAPCPAESIASASGALAPSFEVVIH